MREVTQELLPSPSVPRIASAFAALAPTFGWWVTIMEEQTRLRELHAIVASEKVTPKILLISPPTDPGIKLLASRLPELHCQARISLLCLNDNIRQIAEGSLGNAYANVNLITLTDETFVLPFDNSIFDIVIANCFFDFCYQPEIPGIIREMGRVLKTFGDLFSVHMRQPETCIGSIWASLFKQCLCLSQGCHPVDINGSLAENGFVLEVDSSETKLGFPLKYLRARSKNHQERPSETYSSDISKAF